MSDAILTVPGFNGGKAIRLVSFEVSSALRLRGGGGGRVADWAGRFDIDDAVLAKDLSEHLDRTFEEGHTGIAEIIGDDADGGFRLEGVAARHRGGLKFAFDAFSLIRT